MRTAPIKQYDNYLRWLYRGGRPNRFARLQNRSTAIAFAAGIVPKRAAVLQIRGRRSGRVISFPVAIADFEGERYLVSMLGPDVNWVRNLKPAGGRAVLRHGRRESVRSYCNHLALAAPGHRQLLPAAIIGTAPARGRRHRHRITGPLPLPAILSAFGSVSPSAGWLRPAA